MKRYLPIALALAALAIAGAPPVLAQSANNQAGPAISGMNSNDPSATGGGSIGYNEQLSTGE